jgi:hypothetical protein
LGGQCDTLETDGAVGVSVLESAVIDAIEPLAPDPARDAARDAVTGAIMRGAARLLGDLGFAVIAEFDLPSGRRADLFGLGRDGELIIVEVKSCAADFRADSKWPEYRDWCDRLFFAVDERFPRELPPRDAGLMIADGFGGAVTRPAPVHRLAPARRKALTLGAARAAAFRLERRALAEMR